MVWWCWLIVTVVVLMTVVPFLVSYYSRIAGRSFGKGVQDTQQEIDSDGECKTSS